MKKIFALKPGSWALCPPKIGPGAPTKAEAPDPSPDSTGEEYRKRAAEGKPKIRGRHVA